MTNLDNIPPELQELRQLVIWKGDKKPRNPRNGKLASVSDPSTWGTLDEAVRGAETYGAKGLGLVFTENDQLLGIDLDKVINEDGVIDSEAQAIIDKLDSYTEVSQSGRGIHIIVRAEKPNGRCRSGHMEIYDRGRYFALTGDLWQGRGVINDRQAELDSLFDGVLSRHQVSVDEQITAGFRDTIMTSVAGAARRAGASPNEIGALLNEMLDRMEQPPDDEKTEKDVERIAKSVSRYPPAFSTHRTDVGNAEYITKLYGDEVRYDHSQKRWHFWNGNYWQPDRDGFVSRLAVMAAKIRYIAAAEIKDTKERELWAKWAIASEGKMKIDFALSIASRLEPFADDGRNWDADAMLLGCENGIVDLRTGELRAGRREDRITMTTGLDYDPGAECPRWKLFLREIFDSNEELIDWLWRALGYSITGDCTEHVFMMGYGEGANGKSRFQNAIGNALGDYAHSSPFSTFILSRYTHTATNDVRELDKKRFVTASEVNEGVRLNTERIKALSGEDPLRARYLYREFETFTPHCKLWLFVNHKPEILDDTVATWRRVRLVPFTQTFIKDRADNRLGEKLQGEVQGILAWLVRGCLEWQKRSLTPAPECVRMATKEYKDETDLISRFIEDKCVREEGGEILASKLYLHYKSWAKREGHTIMTQTAFGNRMSRMFLKRRIHGGRVVYEGVCLASLHIVVDMDD